MNALYTRKRLLTTLVLMSFFMMALTSCSDSDTDDKAILTVANDELNPYGAKTTLAISANGTWILTSSEDWVTLSANSGNGDAEVELTADINDGVVKRQATITLKSGAATAAVTLTQDVATDVERHGYELPAFSSNNVFVPHYVTLDGKKSLNYSIEWNNSMHHAQWVAYRFDKSNIAQNVTRSSEFIPDPELPESMRIDNSYHTSDGFDRGHLCPSGDRLVSEEANMQTFYFSNMSPQLNSFNSGIWQKLESEVNYWGKLIASGKYDTVYVAKGGTLDNLLVNFQGKIKGMDGIIPTTDGNGLTVKGLPCPAYYYMAILAVSKGKYTSIAFYVPHAESNQADFSAADAQQYVLSVDEPEAKTGQDFFFNLPDDVENEVEKSADVSAWKWQ